MGQAGNRNIFANGTGQINHRTARRANQYVARVSQRVGAKRGPMTGSAKCGNHGMPENPDVASLIRATFARQVVGWSTSRIMRRALSAFAPRSAAIWAGERSRFPKAALSSRRWYSCRKMLPIPIMAFHGALGYLARKSADNAFAASETICTARSTARRCM